MDNDIAEKRDEAVHLGAASNGAAKALISPARLTLPLSLGSSRSPIVCDGLLGGLAETWDRGMSHKRYSMAVTPRREDSRNQEGLRAA